MPSTSVICSKRSKTVSSAGTNSSGGWTISRGRPCGYFRVVADAGLGKTALAAAAAKRLKAPVFFANASRGLTRPDQCLNHLAVELIAPLRPGPRPPAGPRGRGLGLPGQDPRRGRRRGRGPALDRRRRARRGRSARAGSQPAAAARSAPARRLHAPDAPPRPGRARHGRRDGRRGIPHRLPHDAAQQADIAAYLRQEADRPEIRRAREAANPPISIDRFVAFLKDKSEGNFKYLDYVLADIAARSRASTRSTSRRCRAACGATISSSGARWSRCAARKAGPNGMASTAP